VPVRDRPLDFTSIDELVRLAVAVVVVVLADADDDQHRRVADPFSAADDVPDPVARLLLGDDEQPLTLAEAGARRSAYRVDDAFDRFARHGVRLIRAHHAAPREDLRQIHPARIRRVIRRRVVVHGRVQGVFFRDSVRRLAQQRAVAGWVANRPDGTVEAVFEGEPKAVERLVAFCQDGPRGAEVTWVDVSEETPAGDSSFSVR
jgi:acylphosphatase